jgi:hypothetical protein
LKGADEGTQATAVEHCTFKEVFEAEGHFPSVSVADLEAEPLEVAFGVGVRLHVELVVARLLAQHVLEIASLVLGVKTQLSSLARLSRSRLVDQAPAVLCLELLALVVADAAVKEVGGIAGSQGAQLERVAAAGLGGLGRVRGVRGWELDFDEFKLAGTEALLLQHLYYLFS